ncbi:translation initiation factor IF-2-like isoform X1 [Vulpes lagopus]|uniref:translation initiation factor IF-2-like isoform X1 n=1 Tax=Vulpes lagopus TaxID=494514 RepID=UPI001BC9CFD2|nr:translation initiation factor IF-2-like isoform X1 [Vulpes lagopus]
MRGPTGPPGKEGENQGMAGLEPREEGVSSAQQGPPPLSPPRPQVQAPAPLPAPCPARRPLGLRPDRWSEGGARPGPPPRCRGSGRPAKSAALVTVTGYGDCAPGRDNTTRTDAMYRPVPQSRPFGSSRSARPSVPSAALGPRQWPRSGAGGSPAGALRDTGFFWEKSGCHYMNGDGGPRRARLAPGAVQSAVCGRARPLAAGGGS